MAKIRLLSCVNQSERQSVLRLLTVQIGNRRQESSFTCCLVPVTKYLSSLLVFDSLKQLNNARSCQYTTAAQLGQVVAVTTPGLSSWRTEIKTFPYLSLLSKRRSTAKYRQHSKPPVDVLYVKLPWMFTFICTVYINHDGYQTHVYNSTLAIDIVSWINFFKWQADSYNWSNFTVRTQVSMGNFKNVASNPVCRWYAEQQKRNS